jgi:hypothetical protein
MNPIVINQWIAPGLCGDPDAIPALAKAAKRHRIDSRHRPVIQGLTPRIGIKSGRYYALWEQRLIQGVSIKLVPKGSAMAVQRAFSITEAGMEVVDCIVE